MTRASKGTATRASPKPKADRISVATKTTPSTQAIIQPSAIGLCHPPVVPSRRSGPLGLSGHFHAVRECPGGQRALPRLDDDVKQVFRGCVPPGPRPVGRDADSSALPHVQHLAVDLDLTPAL